MKFAALGSGSEGNAWVVESTGSGAPTRVMVDCGFSLKETVARLHRLQLTPEDLQAVVVTHEHDDHIGGAFRLARRFRIPLWLTAGTFRAALQTGMAKLGEYESGDIRLFDCGKSWSVGDLSLHPFTVPHDAEEPAQFVIGDGLRRLGLMTDCGMPTPHIVSMLSGCDGLVLEANHDVSLLERSSYPAGLKRRIAGDYGHLSNDAACAILSDISRGNLRILVAAHLSQQTNSPDHVRSSWSEALGGYDEQFLMANQTEGLPWQHL